MPYPVKNFRSDDTGLNKITATLGSLVGILDACLVTGFNLRTLDDLTYDSATDLFAGTVNSGHGYRLNQIVKVAGASPSQFNCEIWITAITATTFTGKAHVSDARPASAAASGSMTVKAAPQGSWSKPFYAANGTKAVFRMEDPGSSKCCLRVNNSIACSASYGMYCLVDGYEQMTSVDAGVRQFGYFAAHNNGWSLRGRTSYRDTPWMLVADGSAFWINLKINIDNLESSDPIDDFNSRHFWRSYFFGDTIKRVPGDTYATLLVSGCSVPNSTTDNSQLGLNSNLWNFQGAAEGLSLARNMSAAIGKKQPAGKCTPWPGTYYPGSGPLQYPSPIDNSLIVIPNGIYIMESSAAIRSCVPGYWVTPQLVSDVIGHSIIFENFPGAEGRKFISSCTQYSQGYSSTYTTAVGFIDMTGPWR